VAEDEGHLLGREGSGLGGVRRAGIVWADIVGHGALLGSASTDSLPEAPVLVDGFACTIVSV